MQSDEHNTRVVGRPDAVEMLPQFSITRRNGRTLTRRFVTHNARLADLASNLYAQGAETVSVNPGQNEPVGEVEASYSTDPTTPPGEEAAETIYELRFETKEISIQFSEYYSAIGPARWAAVESLADQVRGITAAEERAAEIAKANLSGLEAEALADLLANASTYEVSYPVVVFRSTVSLQWTGTLGTATQDLIFTTAQISGIYSIPGWFVMPASLSTVKVPGGWLAGWKKAVEVNALSNGSAELIEVYRFAVYNMKLHQAAQV